MPVIIPDNLPALNILKNENVFVMDYSRAIHQDIRAQKVLILNIMPIKETTETHILRLLANTPLQIEIDLIHPKTHTSKNTPIEHLESFYKTFEDVRHQKYDGLIITGAPVEQLDFEDVNYWEELKEIMNWSQTNVTCSLFICWSAQAALYHFYDIPKYMLDKKMFGVFYHNAIDKAIPIIRGFDDVFLAPHSRYTEVRAEDIRKIEELEIISESNEAGVYIVGSKDHRQLFVTGHSEYDPFTLKNEYDRDVAKGLPIEVPRNYFPNDDPTQPPFVKWRSHANLLFTNWLNYYVYQRTPFIFD